MECRSFHSFLSTGNKDDNFTLFIARVLLQLLKSVTSKIEKCVSRGMAENSFNEKIYVISELESCKILIASKSVEKKVFVSMKNCRVKNRVNKHQALSLEHGGFKHKNAIFSGIFNFYSKLKQSS